MPREVSFASLYDDSLHERAIATLARQAQVSIERVTQLYARELATLAVGARITGFLPILTMRKVRELLRHGEPV